jgi:hypothetical protein
MQVESSTGSKRALRGVDNAPRNVFSLAFTTLEKADYETDYKANNLSSFEVDQNTLFLGACISIGGSSSMNEMDIGNSREGGEIKGSVYRYASLLCLSTFLDSIPLSQLRALLPALFRLDNGWPKKLLEAFLELQISKNLSTKGMPFIPSVGIVLEYFDDLLIGCIQPSDTLAAAIDLCSISGSKNIKEEVEIDMKFRRCRLYYDISWAAVTTGLETQVQDAPVGQQKSGLSRQLGLSLNQLSFALLKAARILERPVEEGMYGK